MVMPDEVLAQAFDGPADWPRIGIGAEVFEQSEGVNGDHPALVTA